MQSTNKGSALLSHITLGAAARFVFMFMAAALLLTGPHARADYVASAQEERDWAARIAKSPPNASVLGGAPYPGAKLDSRRSGEQTASNKGEPTIYIYMVRASEDDVRAYYRGPGKREDGRLPIINASSGMVEIKYLVYKKRAAAAPATAKVAATPANTEAAADSTAAPASASTSQAPAEPDTAKQAIDAVNALRGLFGR
jgi:hypothetical protein